MKHPEKRINLADSLNGEKPLAVGDKVTRVGDEKVHCIYGQVNTGTIYMRTEKSPLLWGCTIEAVNRNRLTEDEVRRLLCATSKEGLKSWCRINPDGTKTPLADIYPERVEVGAGSWIEDQHGTLLLLIYDNLHKRLRLVGWSHARASIRLNEGSAAVKEKLSEKELCAMLASSLDHYTLLPPADALKMLAEMEESHD